MCKKSSVSRRFPITSPGIECNRERRDVCSLRRARKRRILTAGQDLRLKIVLRGGPEPQKIGGRGGGWPHCQETTRNDNTIRVW